MIQTWINKALLMLLLGALQILVFNQIHVLGYITPVITVYFLSFFPRDTARSALLVWAFVMGILVDFFSGTSGVTAASLTLVAMIQPPFLGLLVTKDSPEDLTPSASSMGWWRYMQFLFCMSLLHHVVFYLLEYFSFFNWRDLLISMSGSWALSFVLMLVLEYVRNSKK